MKRKIVKHGSNTLTVSLPAKWCKRFNIKNGDEIEVEEQEKVLLLKIEGKNSSLKKIIIDIDNLSQQLIWYYFISAYRSGYDEIIINFSNIEKIYDIKFSSLGILEKKYKMRTLEVIHDVVSRCIGMEIMDHENNSCIVKDLGETSEREFDNTLRRIFFLLISMAEDSFLDIKKETKSLKYTIGGTDTSIDRFTDFCMRVLNKKGYKDFRKTNCIYSIILLLESIGDEYKKIVLHLSESKRKLSQGLIKVYEKINELLNISYKLFYKFEEKKANEICWLEETLTEEIKSFSSKTNNEEKEILHHLKKIKRYILDMLQLTIELNI